MANRTPEATLVAKRDIDAIHEIERLMVPDDENQTREMDDSGLDIVSSDSSDESSSSATGYCTITFAYTEYEEPEESDSDSSSSTTSAEEPKVYHTITVDVGTPYSVVKEQMPIGFPSRERGYWYFTGWSEDFSGEGIVSQDMLVLAQYEAATIKIGIAWNGAENQLPSAEKLPQYFQPFIWGTNYPNFPVVPVKTDDAFVGGYLIAPNGNFWVDDKTKLPIQTHSAQGVGILAANSPILGSNTIRKTSTPEIFTVTSCAVSVVWEDTNITPQEGDDIDAPPAPDPSYCTVTFVYTESDGTEKTKAILQFPYKTSYSEIRASMPGIPSRASGYWYFAGWSEDFSGDGILTEDLVSRAQYEPALVSIEIDWNGASNANIAESGSWSSPFTWMGFFPDITPIPEKQGAQFNGIFLFDGLRVLNRTHNADGKAITIAENPAMGSRTEVVPPSSTVWQIPSCMLKVVWGEPIQWNTQEDLRNAVGAIPCPFADDPSSRVTIPAKDAGDDVSFEKGFPASFVKPIVDPNTGNVNSDARVISRQIVNSLGNIGTQAQFFAQCGGYYTFDQAICDAIGGYPQSAFLRFYDADSNCLRTVYSLVDNNTWNFLTDGVDGVHWKYVDDKPTLSVEIDYGDFIDLGDTLFIESGIPDFYEVPYDSYLQMHALSYCDMHSTLRDEEQYMRARTSLEYNTKTKTYDQVMENLQGAFATGLEGKTFIDVYNQKTNTINSIRLRDDGCILVAATIGDMNTGKNVFYQYKMPRYVVTQGALFLNKGDKIRIRGVYVDRLADHKIGDVSRVHSMILTDMDVQRAYLIKFANLYRIGWRV